MSFFSAGHVSVMSFPVATNAEPAVQYGDCG